MRRITTAVLPKSRFSTAVGAESSSTNALPPAFTAFSSSAVEKQRLLRQKQRSEQEGHSVQCHQKRTGATATVGGDAAAAATTTAAYSLNIPESSAARHRRRKEQGAISLDFDKQTVPLKSAAPQRTAASSSSHSQSGRTSSSSSSSRSMLPGMLGFVILAAAGTLWRRQTQMHAGDISHADSDEDRDNNRSPNDSENNNSNNDMLKYFDVVQLANDMYTGKTTQNGTMICTLRKVIRYFWFNPDSYPQQNIAMPVPTDIIPMTAEVAAELQGDDAESAAVPSVEDADAKASANDAAYGAGGAVLPVATGIAKKLPSLHRVPLWLQRPRSN